MWSFFKSCLTDFAAQRKSSPKEGISSKCMYSQRSMWTKYEILQFVNMLVE